jgi:SNF2 family DNA or RNA helicase
MVAEVAQDLPKKIIIPQPILMDDKFANYYDDFRKEIIRTYDKNSALVSLQLLRMFCCDPSLVLKDGINYDEMNIKFQRLIEIIFEIYKSGGKALIFTSFQEAADKINKTIYNEFKCFCQIIDGRVKVEERQTIIDDFSSVSGSAFLVLNPKAAGTGLNITAANHVIHYNLEWNPSVEDQANARAYRRGQKKPVFIYKFFYIDSVEEFIEKKGRLKRKISEKSIIGIDGEGYNLVDIYAALQLTPILK